MIFSTLRPSSWLKNLAILPAWFYYDGENLYRLCIVFMAATLFSAGNYTFNEWADRYQDAYHPYKKFRYFVQNPNKSPWLLLLGLWVSSLGVSLTLSPLTFLILALLMAASYLYNGPKVRLKNHPHFDYLLEALNAPLRGILGWIAASSHNSDKLIQVCLVYYLVSLTVMLLKRRYELSRFTNMTQLSQYRPSLIFYTSSQLTLTSIFTLTLAVFFTIWALFI